MNINVNTTKVSTPYIADPLSVYSALADDHVNTLLLESAEIDSKDNLKSILLLDASLRIECNGRSVELVSQNQNGLQALAYINHKLADYISQQDEASTTFTFPHSANDLTEDERLKVANPFEVLRTLTAMPNTDKEHAVFLGGALGYDLIAVVEDLPQVKDGENACPDFLFYLAETLLICDHQTQTAELVHFNYDEAAKDNNQANQVLASYQAKLKQVKPVEDKTIAPVLQQSDIQVDMSDEDFCNAVVKLKENIKLGDIFQVVPSRSFSLPCPKPIAAYRKLKIQNPSPYMFYLRDEKFEMFGASPESAVKYTKDTDELEIYPIAGTRRRGFNPDGSINLDLDSRIEQELRSDKKELSEHMMLVDLARNDVARVCEPGTRYVSDLQKVDRYSFVMHLVSRVKGKLRKDLDALHAYQACLNMGTLVGAPKVKAASLIRQVEQKRRGSYGGAVGYVTGKGDMDTCIVIRSAFVQNQKAYIQAGAGVVYDSIPQSEADETRSKAQAVLNAIISSQEVI